MSPVSNFEINSYTKVSEIIFDGDLKPKSQNTILSRR